MSEETLGEGIVGYPLMRIVETDYDELIKQAHRRWIETRDPKDGDRFAAVVQAAIAARKSIECS